MHSVLGVSPFEASHGLPARGVQSHETAANYSAPDYLDGPGITAMQTTAKAYLKHLRQVQQREAKDRAELLNAKDSQPKLAVGDKVVFYIPPTAEEAEFARRKAKHLPQYRGPASITKVLSPTTFELTHNNRVYQRCLSELRPYKTTGQPGLQTGVAPDTTTSFEVGAYVAYRDTDDPDSEDSARYHLGKVINIADGEAHVHCYSTTGKALSRAKWKPLFQNMNGKFSFSKTKHTEAVIDRIPVDEDSWVCHYNVQLTNDKLIAKLTRKQLQQSKVTHHRLGTTFP